MMEQLLTPGFHLAVPFVAVHPRLAELLLLAVLVLNSACCIRTETRHRSTVV